MAGGVFGPLDVTVVYDDTLLQDRNWQLTLPALTLGKHYRACEQELSIFHSDSDSGRALQTGFGPCNRE